MIGERVGHYQILEKIGSGGMGEVWLAEDTRLERKVALKFLPAEAATEEEQARFIREAKAASALDHPNICTIYEAEETEKGRTYIAMAYCDGETVREKIACGPLKLDEALDIAIQIGEGLARAHREGIVHRDIKPANAILTRDGVVKIVDFGLAKLSGATQLTRTGTTMGTVAYMSPEQVKGEKVDPRSDIWALGVLLYEMVTGSPPFESDHEQGIVYSILQEEPEPVTARRARLPIELDRIVEKTLNKNPASRYQHLEDMLVDLKAVRSDTGSGTAPGTGARAALRTRSRKGIITAAAAVLPITVLAAAYLLFLTPRGGGIPSIAVLPFDNLGSSEDDYFAAGVTEELISRLSRLQNLKPIGRNSILRYRNTEKQPRQIGRELGAEFLLTGTTRWERTEEYNLVRITPHLIRAADGIEIWSHTYTSDFTGVFQIQSEVAEQIASNLDIELHPEERSSVQRPPTENLEAYQAYMRGRYYMNLPHFSVESWNRGMNAMKQAVELDSTFALAWAELATTHARDIFHWVDASPERYEMARIAADRAAVMAPVSPEVHLALGLYHLWAFRDTRTAEGHIAIAARVMPNDARVPEAQALVFEVQGRWRESIECIEEALKLNPQDAGLHTELAYNLWIVRDYRRAVTVSDQAILLAPDQMWPYLIKTFAIWSWQGATPEARIALEAVQSASEWMKWTWFWQLMGEGDYRGAIDHLAESPGEWINIKSWARTESLLRAHVFALQGQHEQSRAEFERARNELEPKVEQHPYDPRYRGALGIALAGLGYRDEATLKGREAMELLPLSKDAFYGLAFIQDMAIIYTLNGEHEAALDQLEHLFSLEGWFSSRWLDICTWYYPLRDYPRYRELLGMHN